ncbi:ArsR family transcriptional regulator [Caldicellulosiruptor changbaiensis]|uniref:ArsR family transcriptional regulator n=1 Tax=Caldicellulosiruptor changbaiensis TaxID=1222016 RepID=A0A3T0D891_9FIRM|nr:metalloregulator ArsR/SmtB family transcription factor [Caldicellulosiruptor changbaiensis]AZT91365.1 ArsR family transcriptional regulator [Caldicellulosiruptor changbaiensis]
MSMEERLAKVFKALSHPIRIKIVQNLLSGEKCVCELLQFVEFSQPNLSQHLKILKEAGLLEHRKVGANMHYRIKNEYVKDLLNMAEAFILECQKTERV